MAKVRQTGRHWSILLIVTVGMIACGSAERDEGGVIINSGNLDIATMQIGDCFQDLHPDITMLDDVPGVPCSSPHDNEVFHIFPIDNDDWPGDEVIEQWAFNNCIDAFEAYIGAEWVDSELDFTWYSPTQRAWEQLGYRDIICVAYLDGEPLTGSVKGSRR